MSSQNAYDVVHPICCTQKIKVYETRTRLYLVGSNSSQTRFRILKIDRTEPTEINVIDDKVEYNRREIRDLLHRIDVGNRPKSLKSYEKGSFGLTYRCTAYGILGFIRFLEGHYIILISKRRKVALIGGHAIYKIDDTEIIPIANEQARSKMNSNSDEVKYMRIFQNVDLSSNFYFSYSYDLTRTLQYNLAPYYGTPYKYCSKAHNSTENDNKEKKCSTPKKVNDESVNVRKFSMENDSHKKDPNIENILKSQVNELKEGDVELLPADMFPDSLPRYDGVPPSSKKYNVKVFRGKPSEKYVWNSYILKGIEDKVHPDWLLNIIHGFVGQSNICVYGKPMYITLIARRSNKFAGTRFLKRGANDEGYVANDVETEQICHDASVISLRSGRYTSYVQMRGSAPFFWSQDTIQGRITPKPQILVDRADPYFSTTATHFNSLLSRYGSPIIILNLVKIKEKKPHEQILSGLLKESVEYLNQFLPPQHAMLYKAWDMARVTKCKEQKVIEILAEIAEQVMKETGFFQSGPQIFCNELRKHPSFAGMKGHGYSNDSPGLLQTGILRVNCVDCLDRTNATQFMVGKCALGFQLYALGVVESPILQFDSDALRMLEELFEAHGDTLALQYGGSQMVHRIRTYRKIAPWTSYSRDIMQTVSRYYSNAFTDTDKQQAINLFLGTFKPFGSLYHIWDIPTDYYLHHSSTINLDSYSVRPSYTKWWLDEVMNALPFSWEEKAKRELIESDEITDDDDESMDLFSEYYRPTELTEFETLFCRNMPTSIKDFMPGSSGDPSPFVVRARGRSHGDVSPTTHRHQIGGQPVSIDDSSDDDVVSSDDERDVYSPFKSSGREALAQGDSTDKWPALTNLYGINVVEPGAHDKVQYQRYAEISQLSAPAKYRSNSNYQVSWPCLSKFSNDCTSEVKLPVVDSASQSLYADYCKIGKLGPSTPSELDVDIYQAYIRQNYI